MSVATGSAVLCSLGSAFTFLHNPHSKRAASPGFIKSSLEPQYQTRSVHPFRSPVILFESDKGFVEADDIDAIQELFNKYCDDDGLMTKTALVAMPPFSDMLVSSTQWGFLLTVDSCTTEVARGRISKHSSRITPRQCRRCSE
jgi:hypothetical protein